MMITVLDALADGSEHCVCELMRKLSVTQSRISRHVQALKQANLAVDRHDGQWVCYSMDLTCLPARDCWSKR